MNAGLPVALKGPRQLALIVQMQYRLVEEDRPRGPWKVSTSGYIYELVEAANEKRVVAYHWHPAGRSSVIWPHLHLPGRSKLGKVHLPTGRVALEEVLRLTVHEFEVVPRKAKWEDVLTRTQSAFEDWRSWPAPKRPVP